jgi:uncharacterized protein
MSFEPRDMPRRVAEDAIRDALADVASVSAAYLFGSVATGTAGPMSDLDVGLLIDDAPLERVQVAARIADALSRRLRTSRVDVVSLSDAPVALRYRVVREGALVVSRHPAALERFITDSVMHYLDFKPVRDRAFAIQRAAILGDR